MKTDPKKDPTIIIKKRKRHQIFFSDPSITEQTHKSDCDINTIIKKFTNTGQLPQNMVNDPQYGFAPTIDFKSALDLVKNTRREFDDLHDTEKALFDNNSENYAQFLINYEESSLTFEDESPAKLDTSVSQPPDNTSTDSTEVKND